MLFLPLGPLAAIGGEPIRILIVGKPERAQGLAFSLGLLGHNATASAYSARLTLAALEESRPDMVLLYEIPNQELLELVPLLRKRTSADLIIKPCQYSEADLIYYLESGVIDYLPVPLSPKGLSARLRALHDRRPPAATDRIRTLGEIEVDTMSHIVWRRGNQVALTRLEFRLLEELFNSYGRPCRRKALLEAVWGREFVDCHHYLRIYIRNLRKKLEDDPQRPRLLHTVRGIGYRLSFEGAAPKRRYRRLAHTAEHAT